MLTGTLSCRPSAETANVPTVMPVAGENVTPVTACRPEPRTSSVSDSPRVPLLGAMLVAAAPTEMPTGNAMAPDGTLATGVPAEPICSPTGGDRMS